MDSVRSGAGGWCDVRRIDNALERASKAAEFGMVFLNLFQPTLARCDGQ